jgi:hypothetical protein
LIEWLVVAAFSLWAVGPYLVLGIANGLLCSTAALIILLVGVLPVVGVGVTLYYQAFYVNLVAQSGLACIFVPYFQWGVTVVVGMVAAVFEWRARQSQIANS